MIPARSAVPPNPPGSACSQSWADAGEGPRALAVSLAVENFVPLFPGHFPKARTSEDRLVGGQRLGLQPFFHRRWPRGADNGRTLPSGHQERFRPLTDRTRRTKPGLMRHETPFDHAPQIVDPRRSLKNFAKHGSNPAHRPAISSGTRRVTRPVPPPGPPPASASPPPSHRPPARAWPKSSSTGRS